MGGPKGRGQWEASGKSRGLARKDRRDGGAKNTIGDQSHGLRLCESLVFRRAER